jgi:hypothetical protein
MKSLEKVRSRLRERLARAPAHPNALRGRLPPQVLWLNALHAAARRASWRQPRRWNSVMWNAVVWQEAIPTRSFGTVLA